MQKYLILSLFLLIHLPIDWTTKFHMKETKESRNRDPYLTVAARKPAVQVRKKQTAIFSGHISFQVVKTFRLPRECLPRVSPFLALLPKPQTLMPDCFPYRHLPAVSFPCPK